jgi:hypothetical protein
VLRKNGGSFVLALPLPVTTRSCSAPTICTAPKHHSPSETTVADGAIERAANTATCSCVNGCWRRHRNCG